ncbi:MAG: tryptophan synthase subunit alpha [Lachnospiraceae bacterium]|nr:tryptophan synthase subunit alpha [Lachnospiraceae bacterium]
MNRIEKRMNELKSNNEKAFVTYYTAGLPDMETTRKIIDAQQGVTDVIELGIPFSDPTADGPVIQQASYEAIQGGASLKKTFILMDDIRKSGNEQPIVFMMYYNTIVNYGLDAFVGKCRETGVDGLIVPDLPIEEQEAIREALKGDDSTILIELVSPVSKKRIPEILKGARGFVYCVSSMGVTGQAADFHKEVVSYLSEVKSQSPVPVMMGFGIREAADVKPMKDIIDGAIVGSHFINIMRENNFDPNAAKEYVTKFKKELNGV